MTRCSSQSSATHVAPVADRDSARMTANINPPKAAGWRRRSAPPPEASFATHAAPSLTATGFGISPTPGLSPTPTGVSNVLRARVDASGHAARRVNRPQLARVGRDPIDGVAKRQRANNRARRRIDV